MFQGKAVTVCTMVVDQDGKRMKVTVDDKQRNARITWTSDKL
jgi:hypothetical protein